jgi:hypothetical protein
MDTLRKQLLADKAVLEARLVWAKGELYWDTRLDLANVLNALEELEQLND